MMTASLREWSGAVSVRIISISFPVSTHAQFSFHLLPMYSFPSVLSYGNIQNCKNYSYSFPFNAHLMKSPLPSLSLASASTAFFSFSATLIRYAPTHLSYKIR